MGTTIEILIPKDKYFHLNNIEDVVNKVFDKFKDIESTFSRFLKDSELSQLNTRRSFCVSSEFIYVLEYALDIARKTKGVFNPFINLSTLGYSSDFWSNIFEKKHFDILNLEYEEIRIINNTVSLPKGAFLDLGGCVKGYAVDMAVEILDDYCNNFLINAGGDLFARGRFHNKPWSVGVCDPKNEDSNIFVIDLENQALATSGSYRRKWSVEDTHYHHLVDGNTNKNPNSFLQSVSVQTEKTMDADTWATVAYILGEKRGQEFLLNRNAIGYFF